MEWIIFYPASGPSLDDSYWFNRHLFSPPGGLSGLGEALAAVSEGSVPGSSIWARLASLSAAKRWERKHINMFLRSFQTTKSFLRRTNFALVVFLNLPPVFQRGASGLREDCCRWGKRSCLTSDPNKESLFLLLKFPVIMKETWMSMKHKSKTFAQRRAPSSCCPLPPSLPVVLFCPFQSSFFSSCYLCFLNIREAPDQIQPVQQDSSVTLFWRHSYYFCFFWTCTTYARQSSVFRAFFPHGLALVFFVFVFFCSFPTFHHIRASFQPGGLEWKWGTQLSMLLIFIS